MAYYLKILNVLFLSTVKYFYTPIYAHMIGLDFLGASITMIGGGVLGFLFYYHFSKIVIVCVGCLKPLAKKIVPFHLRHRYNKYRDKRRLRRIKRRKFTWRNRMLVKLGKNYGMYGIIILTPILVSLVLGAFLLRKYYGDRREAVPLMIVSIVVEGAIFVVGYWLMMGDL